MLEGRPPHSLRRRIAGLIILFGVIYIGGRFLSSSARVVRVEIHFHLRNHAEVESLEAEIVPHGGDEPVARFATKLVEKVVVQKPRLKPGSYVVRIILRHKNGDVTRLQRTIHVEQAGVIVVNVSS